MFKKALLAFIAAYYGNCYEFKFMRLRSLAKTIIVKPRREVFGSSGKSYAL